MFSRSKERNSEKRVVQPDDFDFKELFEAHYPTVRRHLMLIVGERAVAEDIAQETFIKLYERPPREFTNLSGWLIKVATNLAYNYLRSEKSRKRREEEVEGAEREPVVGSPAYAGELAEIREVLKRLDYRDRICLILKFSGFSYDEIAGITGIKKSSVGKVLARALEKFKQAYEKEQA